MIIETYHLCTIKYQLCGYKVGGKSPNIQSIWNVSDPFCNVWNFDNDTVEKEKGLILGVESEVNYLNWSNIN